MNMQVDINRLHINLHGISALMIEEAVQGLDGELRRRLGVRNIGNGLSSKTATVDLAELSLSAVHVDSTINVAGLRGLIADRLLDALETRYLSASASTGGDV